MNEDQGPRKPPPIDLDAIHREMDDDWHDAMMDELSRLPPGHAKGEVPAPPAAPESAVGREMKMIEDRDKRRVAYHEAGHAVVATEAGCAFVRACITPNEGVNPAEERFWEGSCSYAKKPGTDAIIGWAGIAAERMLEGDLFDDWSLDVDVNELSDPDRAGIETSETWWTDAETAEEILGRRWADVEKLAAALIEHHALTDWDISQLLKPA